RYGWFAYGDANVPQRKIGESGGIAEVIPGSSPPTKPAILVDTPGDPSGQRGDLNWEFETYAVAKEGKDKGKVYGGVAWGIHADHNRELSTLPPRFISQPSTALIESVKAWNQQASRKDPALKNHSDQAPLALPILLGGFLPPF